jgi:hypothetical protein
MPYLCIAVAAPACTIIPIRLTMSEQDFLELPIWQMKKACARKAQAFAGFVAR